MKKLLFCFVLTLLFSATELNARSYKIKFSVPVSEPLKVYLAGLHGDETIRLDSSRINNGIILFSLDEKSDPGMYRIIYSGGNVAESRTGDTYLDFIFNGEEVELELKDDIFVRKSEENRKYYRFLKLRTEYRRKMRLLLELEQLYDATGSFYSSLRDELLSVQMSYNDSLIRMSDTDPGMLASSIISFNQEPIYDPDVHETINEFMRENYLKPVNFTDERLLNTQFITQKIMSYLGLFPKPGNSQQENEELFKVAVDKIMEEVSYNEAIYDFVLNYLIDGFEQLQMEEVLVYIADNHLTGECKTENEEIVKERLEAYKRMSKGKTVPDINLLDPFNIPHRLSEMNHDRILIIFWSSQCPHCNNLIPRVQKWYERNKNETDLGIYAVSIDESRADWEEYVLINDLEWINVFDPEGWESKTSRQYNIYATPTMFLTDRDLMILAKPVNFRDLKRDLENSL